MKRRIERITYFRAYPIETQQAVFTELIENAKDTEWGKKYDYASIESITDFQNRVPVSSYEDFFPYIERNLRGEQNILWPTDIHWFSKSSGTTNARSKYLPVSSESLEKSHFRGGKDIMTLILENKPDTKIYDGKGLSIGGALHPNPYDSTTFVGDVSAIITKNLPTWADYIRTPSIEIALLDNWEEKMEKMIEVCAQENVTSILGVPTWTVVLLENIMERTGAKNMLEVWPNFEFFVHGAVNFQPYRQLFAERLFPSKSVNYLETYNASEGFFGVQDDLAKVGEMLLMLDYGIFYEFIPLDANNDELPQVLTLDQVRLDTNYALIISTNAGLWRYRIGDTIKFTSLYPFRIKVSGRTKHFINAFGEEVIIENAEVAITRASEATGALIADYTAGPVYMENSQKGRHEWIIECHVSPTNETAFVHILDQTLREVNSDYDAKRFKDMALLPPLVHFVPSGTFYNWMQQRGKLGGQHKVPRLTNSREYLEQLLALIHKN